MAWRPFEISMQDTGRVSCTSSALNGAIYCAISESARYRCATGGGRVETVSAIIDDTFMCKFHHSAHVSTIAEFSIPTAEFALSETLERRPDMVFEIDRVVAHDTTHVVPFVRATHGEFEGLTEILEDDASVAEIELLAEVEGESYYRMVWTDRAQVIGYMVAEQGATVHEAVASDGEWHLRVFFPERRGLSATNDYAQENGFTLDVTHIYGLGDLEEAQHNLSEQQYHTLTTAVERGYYDIPREINAEELADELDISHQALSERFRRATKNLVKSSLLVDEDEAN